MNPLKSHTIKVEQIEKWLGTSRPNISFVKKSRMKKRVLEMISANSQVEFSAATKMMAQLKKESLTVLPNLAFRSVLKEKLDIVMQVHERLQHKTKKAFRWFSGGMKALSAGALVVVFFLATIFNFALSPTITQAAVLTVLEEVSGDVTVVRYGEMIRPTNGFLLRTNDKIITSADSRAIVRFLDDSVSRLDENTTITLAELRVNPTDKTETNVEVVVERGRLWTRVISLINKWSSFQVKSANIVTVAKRKAAFDVSIDENGSATVAALHNRVDVKVATRSKVVETNLVKGYSAAVTTTQSLSPSIKKIDETEDATWVNDNLKQDENYIAAHKQMIQDQVTTSGVVTSDNPLYALKQLSQSTQIVLSLSDLEKQKKIISLADTRLAEAQALLQKKDYAGAQKVLADFKVMVAQVTEWVRSNNESNSRDAEEVRTLLQETLHSYKKQMSLLLPTDDLYLVKEVVAEAQLALAKNPAELTEQKLEAAADKLIEAHDLAEDGNHPLVKEQLADYSKAVGEVVHDAMSLSDNDKEKTVSAIIDAKAEDIKVLDAITAATQTKAPEAVAPKGSETAPLTQEETDAVAATAAAVVSDQKDLEDVVDDAKTEALTQLGEAVFDAQRTKSSPVILDKLQQIGNAQVNGKALVGVTVTQSKVTITTDSKVISVTDQGKKTFDVRPAAEEGQVTIPTTPLELQTTMPTELLLTPKKRPLRKRVNTTTPVVPVKLDSTPLVESQPKP